ncbi:MAG: hypothetical protein JNN30_11090 [Rhodanobacteraceae bacterium]|nr:hypothetical protein [Rhodanobacteraceae bacterium]
MNRNTVASRSWRWISWAILLLGLVRAAALLVHTPMLGVANNYDMIRVQGCIDVFPIRDAAIPHSANSWQAPIERYQFRSDVEANCFLSSEALFAFLAAPLMHWESALSADGGFSLRIAGWLKFTSFSIFSFFILTFLLRQNAVTAALVHSLLVAVVLTDPGVTVYLNTFYAEFSAFFFAYAALALVAAAPDRRPSTLYLISVALAVALACASKIQHIVFGLFLLAALVAALRFGRDAASRPLLAAVAAGALAGLALQAMHLRSAETHSIRGANLTNTVLGTVLKTSPNPQRTASHLGLPADCGNYAGQNWFTPGLQENHPCPALLDMSRARFAYLALREPGLMLDVYGGALQRAQSWITPDLGLVAGQVQGKLPASMPTLDTLVRKLPLPLYGLLLLGPALLMTVAAITRLPLGRRLGSVLAVCALYPPCALVVVVLGDGFADVVKQFHLGTTAALCFWVTGLALLPGLRSWRRAGTQGPRP